MIYILTDNLSAGMVLARDIFSGTSYLPLLTRGKSLTKSEILRIGVHGIPGVYIENPFSDGVEVPELVNTKLKREVMTEIKGLYRHLEQKGTPGRSFGSVIRLSAQLVGEILGREEIMCNIMDIKTYDDYTYSHSMCVGILAALVGIRFGMSQSQLTDLTASGLLHDVGKTELPIELINKPGALTEEEYEVIKNHPTLGVRRLEQSRLFSYQVLQGVGSHHERFDGTGYPQELAGDDIPIFAKILSVVDVYDALTSKRPYRKALYPHDALEYIMGGAGSQFDYDVVVEFTKTVAAYPVGTFVTLSNGCIALVVRNERDNTLRPVVRLVSPPETAGLVINLQNDTGYLSVTITGVCEVCDLPEGILR